MRGLKKNLSYAYKTGSWVLLATSFPGLFPWPKSPGNEVVLLGVLVKISDVYTRPFYMGVPPDLLKERKQLFQKKTGTKGFLVVLRSKGSDKRNINLEYE